MNEQIFARIENEKVVNVEVATPEFINGNPDTHYVEITDMNPMPGIDWEYKNNSFTPPPAIPDTRIFLTITLPPNPIAKATNINVVAEVKDSLGNLVNVTSTYYVPVIRKVDNFQAAFLEVSFTNGQANLTFQLSEQGIYTLRMSDIYPTPSAVLQEDIVIIVT